MTIRDLLNESEQALNHLQSPSLDCEVILSFVLDKDRAHILAHLDEEVPCDKTERFRNLIARRAKHEPAAYLMQNKEFYGRNFYVDERVHIPRPGTEDLIDCVLYAIAVKRKQCLTLGEECQTLFPRPKIEFNGTIADIGTGSGCIAITLALEFPRSKIIATDISDGELNVARKNADKLGASDRITFLKGDLLSPVKSEIDIIVSNPPYGWTISPLLPRGRLRPGSSSELWTNSKEVFFQPKESYDGGNHGLELIKKLITGLPHHLKKDGKCFLEFDPRQTDSITQLAQDNNFDIAIKKDTANFDRIAILTRKDS